MPNSAKKYCTSKTLTKIASINVTQCKGHTGAGFKHANDAINVNWLFHSPGTCCVVNDEQCTDLIFFRKCIKSESKSFKKMIWNQNQRSVLSSDFKSKSKDHESDLKSRF